MNEKTNELTKDETRKADKLEQPARDRVLPEIDAQELTSVTGAGTRHNGIT